MQNAILDPNIRECAPLHPLNDGVVARQRRLLRGQTLLLGKLSDYQNFWFDSPEHNNERTFWPPFVRQNGCISFVFTLEIPDNTEEKW